MHLLTNVGYEPLHDRGSMLQRDVSIGNLMMNEDVNSPSWPSFLIDLDLAIKSEREEPSGAPGGWCRAAMMVPK